MRLLCSWMIPRFRTRRWLTHVEDWIFPPTQVLFTDNSLTLPPSPPKFIKFSLKKVHVNPGGSMYFSNSFADDSIRQNCSPWKHVTCKSIWKQYNTKLHSVHIIFRQWKVMCNHVIRMKDACWSSIITSFVRLRKRSMLYIIHNRHFK